MLQSQRLAIEQSEKRERVNALLSQESMTAEERSELDPLQKRLLELEPEYRAALASEGADLEDAKANAGEPDAELRERIQLRRKAQVGNFLRAAIMGRGVTGAEAELQAASGEDGIPIELWDIPEERAGRAEERAITPAPGTVGINFDPVRPAVFAPSVVDKLMVDMPRVASGTYATGTISSTVGSVVTADAVAKSAEVPQTAGAITVQTTTPHRVGASLGLTLEDIAAIGTENFESILRENVSLVLSAELDDQMLNGDGMNDDLIGIFERLTDPAAPAANVETWTRFLAIQSGGIDGLWATMLSHIAMVVNPETYRLACATFQGTDSEESAASYMDRMGAGFWTNSRMPDKAAHIAPGILCRKGRPGMRTAVAPVWGNLSVDDIYSGARKGERYFTISALVGDVILVQPSAYAQVAFRVST